MPGTGNARTRIALNVVTRSGSSADAVSRQRMVTAAPADVVAPLAVAPGNGPGGLPPFPSADLRFQGGRILTDLTFTNFFLGGEESWQASDVASIDQALAAAMSDPHLNNVLVQYFFGNAITSSFQPSRFLPGPRPATVSRGDVEQIVVQAHGDGSLEGFDLANTVFNLMLPSGTVLTDDVAPSGGQAVAPPENQPAEEGAAGGEIGAEDKASSLEGLGGYHGSVEVGADTVYFAVGAFSEVLAGGTSNGIPFFPEPWKNVVATFYHELSEARTDPDVEKANATGDNSFVGWISSSGEEIGDFALRQFALDEVLKEVPLANGTGTVPIQFEFSDFVHTPEGPTDQPRPALQG